jgi:hypothetical protein
MIINFNLKSIQFQSLVALVDKYQMELEDVFHKELLLSAKLDLLVMEMETVFQFHHQLPHQLPQFLHQVYVHANLQLMNYKMK